MRVLDVQGGTAALAPAGTKLSRSLLGNMLASQYSSLFAGPQFKGLPSGKSVFPVAPFLFSLTLWIDSLFPYCHSSGYAGDEINAKLNDRSFFYL